MGYRAGLDGCEKSFPRTGIRSPDRPALFTPKHMRNLGVQGGGRMSLQYLLCLRIFCGYLVEGRQMKTEIFRGSRDNNSTAVW